MGERANDASFVYLDTVAAVERFTSEIAATREIALDTEGRELPPLRRSHLSAAALDARSTTPSSIRSRSACRRASARCSRIPSVEVVFHDADYDLRLLQQDYGWQMRNIFDTRIAAQLLGYTAFGLAALLERFFDVKLDKKHQRADWSMRPLTDGHARLRGAGHALPARSSRTQLAAELERIGPHRRGRARSSRCSRERAGRTRSPGSAYLRAERRARPEPSRARRAARARPVARRGRRHRSIARPSACSATSSCSTSRARSRGRRRRSARSRECRAPSSSSAADELLDAVARALAVPEAELPKFPRAARWDRDPEFDARVSALKTARDAAAKRLELDPGRRSARAIGLEAVARRNPATVEESRRSEASSRAHGRWPSWRAEPFVEALAPHRKSGREGRSAEPLRAPCTPAPSARSDRATRRASRPG